MAAPTAEASTVPSSVPSTWTVVADSSATRLPLRIAFGSESADGVGLSVVVRLQAAVDIASRTAPMANADLRN
jgi:hypothetical protein